MSSATITLHIPTALEIFVEGIRVVADPYVDPDSKPILLVSYKTLDEMTKRGWIKPAPLIPNDKGGE